MLSQTEADRLINLPKSIGGGRISFPSVGRSLQLPATSLNGHDQFVFYINRKGASLKLSKCTYLERHANVEGLVRLDVDGPTHENPDGERIPCPHIHIYREGYDLKWALPAHAEFPRTSNLAQTMLDFLLYCHVTSLPPLQLAIQ